MTSAIQRIYHVRYILREKCVKIYLERYMIHSSSWTGRSPLKVETCGSNPAWITNILGHRQVVTAPGLDPGIVGSNPAVPAK